MMKILGGNSADRGMSRHPEHMNTSEYQYD